MVAVVVVLMVILLEEKAEVYCSGGGCRSGKCINIMMKMEIMQ